MENEALIITQVFDLIYDLIDNFHPCFLISKMRSHRLLSELLNQNINQAIENPRGIKKLFVLHHGVVRFF